MASKKRKRRTSNGDSKGIRTAAEQILDHLEDFNDFTEDVADAVEDCAGCDEEDLARDPKKLDRALQTVVKSDSCVEEIFDDMEGDGTTVDWSKYGTSQKRQILSHVIKSPQFRQQLVKEMND